MSFLNFENKTFVVFGVANKKSVAWHIADVINREGGRVVFVVRSRSRHDELLRLLPGAEISICDVESDEQIERAASEIAVRHPVIHGIVHSIAFANYSGGFKPFHETKRA